MPNSEDYQWYKRNGICTHCLKNKAEPKITLCLECKMENRKYRSSKKKTKEERKIYDAQTRLFRKEHGLCTACGKHTKERGLLCNRCYAKARKNAKKHWKKTHDIPRSEYVSYGMCYYCGSTELVDGKKLCKKCYETRLACIDKIKHWTLEQKNSSWKERKVKLS